MSKIAVAESPQEWGWAKVFAKKERQALEAGIFCCQPGKSLPLHAHNEGDEYCYLFKGSGVFVMNGEEIRVAEGELIKIPRGVEHLSYPTGNQPFHSFYLICP
jgi:quercetin dioxygenase-like cupin family protein